jgi:hypothetical protein
MIELKVNGTEREFDGDREVLQWDAQVTQLGI